MTALLPTELAWYATGRFYGTTDGELADYGYFLHLPFDGVPLFDGTPSEKTAHFTFAARPFKAAQIDNGVLTLGLDPVGEFSLYLQRRPAATFDKPASFMEGERIATFRRTSLAVGTTVAVTVGATPAPVFATNVFSARLVASVPFDFAGVRHDLAHHIGRGITQFGTAAATPVTPPPPGYEVVLPFTGSAIALG
ncbi:hypothetical protein [Nitrospirillum viridazoti]|uniref:Uncharacterized protein n=1 Tax=Nitrospirillum viridazoti CBAmc TaxID=1441467 RepID=A0A248JNT9_9PROT|nr:hypothetical protein [Nitrospirillum amazonense]ASG20365.1 hypothetical protein Y958_05695 [Nitrospirillum amazonense CBAmc]TWB34751.1 hypothetical protein FBZ91_11183 [Nitrospirillum amazonense]